MEWWKTLLSTIALSGTTACVIAYLGKVLLKQLFLKETESFKNDLKMYAYEHDIKFLKLHDKKFEVIAEVYRCLVKTNFAMKYYIKEFGSAGDLSEKERGEDAAKNINNFIFCYNENKIYIDESICSVLDNFIQENKKIFFDFNLRQLNPQKEIEIWRTVSEKFEKDVQAIKIELEREFRKVII